MKRVFVICFASFCLCAESISPHFCQRPFAHDQDCWRGDVETVSPEYEEQILKTKTLIVPLGTDCFPAHALRDLGLRFLAFPFDWGITPASAVLNAFKDDFAHFFCELKLDQQVDWTPHFWVRDVRYGFLSAHDFAKEGAGEWHSQIPTIRQKYQRRAERLLHCFAQGTNKTIYFLRTTICADPSNVITPNTPPSWPHDFCALMRSKYPSLKFRLIVAGCDQWLKMHSDDAAIIHVYDSNCERFGWSPTPIEKKLAFLRELFIRIDPALTSADGSCVMSCKVRRFNAFSHRSAKNRRRNGRAS